MMKGMKKILNWGGKKWKKKWEEKQTDRKRLEKLEGKVKDESEKKKNEEIEQYIKSKPGINTRLRTVYKKNKDRKMK